MIDSFKGTLTSKKAGNIVKETIQNKNIKVDVISISDGGEGFLEVIKEAKKLEYKKQYIDINDLYFLLVK